MSTPLEAIKVPHEILAYLHQYKGRATVTNVRAYLTGLGLASEYVSAVNKLVGLGAVDKPNPDDHRGSELVMTEAGKALLSQYRKMNRDNKE